MTLAIALLFTLQGIPCVYYGTEQGLQRHRGRRRQPRPERERVEPRSAVGQAPNAFDARTPTFAQIRRCRSCAQDEPPLAYGRLYFREVSGNGVDFGHSLGAGGLVAFSRILVDREVLVVANTGGRSFSGVVVIDRDLNAAPRELRIAYSNHGTSGKATVAVLPAARFHHDGQITTGHTAALAVALKANEVQVLAPA